MVPPGRTPSRIARWTLVAALCLLCLLWLPAVARAQTDEIQVYDAQIAAPGSVTLTWHNNFTVSGHTVADHSGGVIPEHALNGVPEWAYGVTDWFEAGLYLPLYTISRDGAVQVDGAKLRALFVAPDAAQRQFFYGINFEFSFNSTHWDANRYTSEIRPILGWHLGSFDVIFNPILDNSWHGLGRLQLEPATRLAWNASRAWTLAAEEYASFGPLQHFYSASQQSHQLFGVADYRSSGFSAELGMGFGLTAASDARVVKLILEFDLR